MTLNIGTLVGYLELNDTQLNRKADAATKKIDGLMLHLNALAKNNPKLNIDVQTKQLEQAKAEIEALKAEGAKGVDVNVRIVAALAKLDALQTKIREIHNAEIKVHVEDKEAWAKLDAIQAKAATLGGKGGLLGSALAFGPAFLPMLNAIPGGLFAIGSGAVASASGVGVLALAFNGLGDSIKAYQDYEAKLPFAKNAKQVAELKKQLALSAYGSQTDSGRDFTRLVATKGAKAASGIKHSAQAGVFPGATKALQDILPLVPTVERVMKSLGRTVGDMTDETAKALNSPFWRQWFHWLGEDAKTQLPLVGSIFGHFFTGIMRGIQRFSPLGTELLKWFDDMMIRFDHWTGSPAFDTFMANTATDAHAVMDALRPFGKVFGEIYAGLSATGTAELKVFGAVMSGLASLPVGVLHAIGSALPIIFLGLKGIGLTSSISNGITSLGGAFTLLRGETTKTQTAIAGVAGAAGLGLLFSATQQTSQGMGVLQGALGGAATGFALTGNPIGALIGGAGGGLLGLFTAGHQAAQGIDAATQSIAQQKLTIEGYETTLDGLNAKITKATESSVLDNIKKARGGGAGDGQADVFKGLAVTDQQLLNAAKGRAKQLNDVTKAINAPLSPLQNAVVNQQKAVDRLTALSKDPTYRPEGGLNAFNAEFQKNKDLLAQDKERLTSAQRLARAQIGFLNDLGIAQGNARKTAAELLTVEDRVKAGVPKPIARLVDDEGVKQDIGRVAQLIRQFGIVDHTTWKAVLQTEGIDPSSANVKNLKDYIKYLNDAARDRQAKIFVNTVMNAGLPNALVSLNNDGTVNKDHNKKTGNGQAAGGTVPGQRMPYGDKVLTPTAPGEEIISNDRGQADMNREVLKAANAGARIGIIGYAGGGTVDPLAGFGPEDVPGSAAHHKKKRKHGQTRKQRLSAQLTVENKALTQAKQAIADAQSWSQAFGGNVFGADLSAYMPKAATTTSMVNGMMVTQSGGAAAQTPQNTLLAMLAYQNAQKTQAQNLSSWVAKLRKEGVSKGVLDQMQAGGAGGIAQIQALASGSVDQVRQFNAANSATTGLLNNTGALATSGKTYSELQRQQMALATIIKAITHALHKPVAVTVVGSSKLRL